MRIYTCIVLDLPFMHQSTNNTSETTDFLDSLLEWPSSAGNGLRRRSFEVWKGPDDGVAEFDQAHGHQRGMELGPMDLMGEGSLWFNGGLMG